MEPVTLTRIIIIGILVFFFFFGMRRGFIRQCLAIIGIVAAFVGAFYLAHHLAGFFQQHFDLSYKPSVVISAVVLFVGIIVGFHFLGVTIQKLINITPLGMLDRFGGAVLGCVKGVLFVSLLLVIVLSLPLPKDLSQRLKKDSLVRVIYPVLPAFFDMVLSISPSDLDFNRVMNEKVEDDVIENIKEKASGVKNGIDRQKGKLTESVSDQVQN